MSPLPPDPWLSDPWPHFRARALEGHWWRIRCRRCPFTMTVVRSPAREIAIRSSLLQHWLLDCPGGRKGNTGERH